LKDLLKYRFREMMSYEAAVISGDSVEALHDMRVAGRRVHALMKVFRGCFSEKAFKSQYSIIRTLIRSLGRVRECDVFIELLDKHRESIGGKEETSLDILRQRFMERRNDERKELQWTLRLLSQMRYEEHFFGFIEHSV
jgi:triphosphatase